jgi:hypothetical protein
MSANNETATFIDAEWQARIAARWQDVLDELADAMDRHNVTRDPAGHHSAYAVDDDDRGMCDVPAADLLQWIDDLADRIGVDVEDGLRDAVYDFIAERDTAAVYAALHAMNPRAPWRAEPADPRGMYLAGAELQDHSAETGGYVGAYVDHDGTWQVCNLDLQRDDAVTPCADMAAALALVRTLATDAGAIAADANV